MKKWEKLVAFVQKHRHVHYDTVLKGEFIDIGNDALKELKAHLEKTGLVSKCKISYNAGGIAVSGDFHLKGDYRDGESFDMFFNMDFSTDICYRKTKDQKDYTGERNNSMRIATPLHKVAENILLLKYRNSDALAMSGAI